MNEVEALLDDLRAEGIELWVDGDQLRYRSRAGAFTPELTRRVREQRNGLISSLKHVERQNIPRVPDDASYVVSDAQRRMWVLAQMDAASVAYNVPVCFLIEGKLDRRALEKAFVQLLARHEALRTTFVDINGEPQQIVHPAKATVLRDLQVCPGRDVDEQAREFSIAEASQRFDLRAGPLFRASLLQLGLEQHVLFLTAHHIICDGWSLRVIMKDLAAFYSLGEDSPKQPALLIQYRDYAAWQQRSRNSVATRADRDYWLSKLAGELPTLDFPLDHARPALQGFRGASVCAQLSSLDLERLREFARARHCTVFAVLIATVKVLLHRYTGQTDIIIGTVDAGRSRIETEDQVGCYLNTLILRDNIGSVETFDEIVDKVRKTMLEALDHRDYPFDRLIDELKLPRDLSRAPLFDVMIISQSAAELCQTMGSVHISHVRQTSRTSKFDLSFEFEEGEDLLRIEIEYDSDLFGADRIERMGAHLRTLLSAAIRNPSRTVGELPLISADELAIITGINATDVPMDRVTLVQRLKEAVRRTPTHTAIVFGEQRVSYSELEARALAVTQSLRDRGVRAGEIVGVLVSRSPDLIASLLGVLFSGAAYLPLDAVYPPERLTGMLLDSQARLVITDARNRSWLPSGAFSVIELESDVPTCASPELQAKIPGWGDLAYVIYTSGSTGRPKGVQVTHGALANFLGSMEREPGMRAGDVIIALTTVCFDIATLEMFLPLCVSATLVMASAESAADGRALLDLMLQSPVTVLQATPATWRMLIAAGWKGSPDLRVLCGGEALPRELSRELSARAKEVWNLYGPTETAVWSAAYRVAVPQKGDAPAIPTEPIGRPIANTRLYALDQQFAPVPLGVGGELYIGGAGVARGYWNRPALTADKFVPDPFSLQPGSRMYRTGDLVRTTADGLFDFLGRHDQQVKLRGFRIELGEIEACLCEHPEVLNAVVVLRSSEDKEMLVAYLVTKTGKEPAGIRLSLAERLPGYMVPAQLVCLTKLPLTPNGKIDRRALLRIDGAAKLDLAASIRLPRDELEIGLAAIFKEVLQVDTIGIDDDFFELGGHSLKAIQVAVRVEHSLAIKLSLRDVFQMRSVAKLAAVARTNSAYRERHLLLGHDPHVQVAVATSITAEELALLND
jgi:amino acid adenylation domain-containing protein